MRAEGLEPSLSLRKNGFSYPSTAFAALAVCGKVWGLDYPFTMSRMDSEFQGAARLVSTPSRSEKIRKGLARDRHVTGFPEFEQFYSTGFPAGTQVIA